ncbi:uncharacterized protein LOC134702189 [Mytilus trossulus]|uniref:uncharacterized protein LOC134702189 n=1 Tax=Mytilus trossulus TaxID=6551 RepID=UPI0030073845
MTLSVGRKIWKLMYSFTILAGSWTVSSAAICEFPDELQGIWYSSHKGNLNFNGTEVLGYPIAMSATVSELNFNCTEKNGDYYLLMADRYVFTLNTNVRAYICLRLHRVSAYKYYYYLGSTLTTIYDYVYGVLEGQPVTLSEACDRTEPYEESTFITLIKNDTGIIPAMTESSCPSQFLASYSNVLITDTSGSTTCDGNSVDGCSSNLTAMSYTYQACSSGLVFNSAGSVSCIYYLTSNGITYLHTWNNDVTVDDSTTYRMVCYAMKSIGSTVYATVYPHFCSDVKQNHSDVASPGIKLQFSQSTQTCATSVTDYNYAGYIFLIIIMTILISILVIGGCILYKKLKDGDKTLKDTLCCWRHKHQIQNQDQLELSGRDFPRIKTAKLRKVI